MPVFCNLLSSYQNYQNGDPKVPLTTVCGSPFAPPNVWLEHHPNNTYAGTVNSNIEFELHRFPIGVTVNLRWDSTVIDSVVTNAAAEGIGDFKVPAAPMGNHALEFKYGHWAATGTFTVKPRIKIIPSEDIARDQTVNVSLRATRLVRLSIFGWKKGTGWYQIAQVTTSATGSANINVKVPKFVPDGATKVRGDSVSASGGRAQTNAVSVFGGPFSASSVRVATPTPLPTNTPQVTASPTPTATATQTPEPAASPEPTTLAATPDASASAAPSETPVVETPSPEPTETATATPEAPTTVPTEPAPIETPTP